MSVWSTYADRLEHYFITNDIIAEAKRRSILLTVAGPEVYSLVCNLVAPDKLGDKSYDDLVALIKKHFPPHHPLSLSGTNFHTQVRNQGESLANFVADLHNIAKHCEFNDVLDDMLSDRFVGGVNEPKIQKRLLAEPKLTLTSAFDLAQALETASKDLLDLDIQPSQAQPLVGDVSIHQVQDKKQGTTCYHCGGQHPPTGC